LQEGRKAMKIEGKVALITGAASGIGEAVAFELARRGVKAVAAVDRSPRVSEVARAINERVGWAVAVSHVGDATDPEFRAKVFEQVSARHGVVNICVPAAGIARDALAVKLDRETGRPARRC
jgi:NAD(P)-dependent dehydrogenase (short-subunit alcohol dehydrogenase family)